jgi:shikimate dehydrogenase
LLRLGVPLAGAHILVLGAGGAIRGIPAPLLEQGPATVFIANRAAARAEQLVRESAEQAGKHCTLRGGSFE